MADQNISLYLSDVHVYNHDHHSSQSQTMENKPFNLSRFFFSFPSKHVDINDTSPECTQVVEDEDGDFDMILRTQYCPNISGSRTFIQETSCHRLDVPTPMQEISYSQEVITIEHMMQTSLQDVGYQVWLGALLMCDFLLHQKDELSEKTALDLGAGTGLTSIVAALCCKKVISTDYCQDIIRLAQRNWERNQGLLPVPTNVGDMKFMILNWTENDLGKENKRVNPENQDSDDLLRSATLILAAEAVYDDELTDACFSTIYHLLKRPPEKEVLLAVERRTVFSSATQEICSPAYEHFMDNLTDLSSINEGDVRFAHQQIPIHSLPKYFVYTRTKELELWRISSNFISKPSHILTS